MLAFLPYSQAPLYAPAIVRTLEADFLANVDRGLSKTPYLGDAQRSEIRELLDRGAEARDVGDRLLRFFAERKLAAAAARYGNDAVHVSVHPAARVFEPLQSAQPLTYGTRPSLAGDLLEATFANDVLKNGGFSVVDEMTFFLASDLLNHGWYVHDGLPAEGAPGETTTLRIGSISALERGLCHVTQGRSARFCFLAGVIPSADMNELHDQGYHGVGLPMDVVAAHDQIYEPLDLALHDAWHGAHWSVHVSPWTRRAAAALHRLLKRQLTADELERIRDVLDYQLTDLLLEVRGLKGVIEDLRKALPPRTFVKAMKSWETWSIPV